MTAVDWINVICYSLLGVLATCVAAELANQIMMMEATDDETS